MTGLFGFVASRPEIGATVLSADAGAVEARSAGDALRWGIGYFQGDDILLRRRPSDPRSVVPVGQMVADVKSRQLIGYYGAAKANAMHTDDTHPFRYRTWLFAHTGVMDGNAMVRERLLEFVPDFLRSSMRGETAGELLFHLFLSNLHAHGTLQSGTVEPDEAKTALRELIDRVEQVSSGVGVARPELNIIVANGQFVVAARTGRSMLYRAVRARELEELFGHETPSRRGVDFASTRVSLIASSVVRNAAAYRPVPAGSLLTLTHDAEPVCEPIERRVASRVAFAA